MKNTTEPERILNIIIRGNLTLKMTEPMKKLYDDFWEKEKKFYEDESISEEEYDTARKKFEVTIKREMKKCYPCFGDIEIDDFDEKEN